MGGTNGHGMSVVVLQALLFVNVYGYQGLVLGDYVYPAWAEVIGWCLTMSSILCVPGFMIYWFGQTKGTFKEVSLMLKLTHAYKVVVKKACAYQTLSTEFTILFYVLFNDALNTFNGYIGVGNILIGKIPSGYLTGIDLRSTACLTGAYTTRLSRHP